MLQHLYTIFLASVFIACALGILKVLRILIDPFISPIRYIPGPPNDSWVSGHFASMFSLNVYRDWIGLYGNTLRYKGMFNVRHDIFHYS